MSFLTSQIEGQDTYKVLPAVKEIRLLNRIGTDWFASMVTWPKFNKQPVAMQILIAATRQNPFITRFAVQLDDNPFHVSPNANTWFSFDTTTGAWQKSNTPPDWVSTYVG